MVKANEVRVNNWFLSDNNERFQVGREILLSEKFWSDLNENKIQPISLTTELLECCGFEEQQDETIYSKEFNDLFRPLELMFLGDGQGAGITYKWEEVGRSFRYLHQLQNVFHALTQIELEIKFP